MDVIIRTIQLILLIKKLYFQGLKISIGDAKAKRKDII
jgi:hypothetical protein